MSLKGRVAAFTGGNRGIGKGIALGVAADGADLVSDQNTYVTGQRVYGDGLAGVMR